MDIFRKTKKSHPHLEYTFSYMKLSSIQNQKINAAVDVANNNIVFMKKGIKDATPRLKRLHDEGFHIESLMVNGQLVEHAIKTVLHGCKLKREVAKIIGAPDPFSKKLNLSDFTDKPLGPLVGLLKWAIRNDQLCEDLTKFNEFRKDFTHHVFNGTRELDEMDKKADEYLKSPNFHDILLDLVGEHMKLQRETNALLN